MIKRLLALALLALVAASHAHAQQHQQAQPLQAGSHQPLQSPPVSSLGVSPVTSDFGSLGCPSIAYTHKLDCGDAECKASFINLDHNLPLDWVDIHLVKTSPASLSKFLGVPNAQLQQLSLAAATPDTPQLNAQMSLAIGEMSSMRMHQSSVGMHAAGELSRAELSSPIHAIKFGAASVPASILAETNGKQVWQFPVPLSFVGGDMIGISFTYSAKGTDCNTEVSFYQLKEVDEAAAANLPQQQAPFRVGASVVQPSVTTPLQQQQQQLVQQLAQQQLVQQQLVQQQQPAQPAQQQQALAQSFLPRSVRLAADVPASSSLLSSTSALRPAAHRVSMSELEFGQHPSLSQLGFGTLTEAQMQHLAALQMQMRSANAQASRGAQLNGIGSH